MEKSKRIEDYKLPVIDVQKQRRNFTGVQEDEYYSLDDMRCSESGPTDTDQESVNDKDDTDEWVESINRTKGKVKDWGGKKLSAETINYSNDTKVYGTYGLGGSAKKSVAHHTMSRGR